MNPALLLAVALLQLTPTQTAVQTKRFLGEPLKRVSPWSSLPLKTSPTGPGGEGGQWPLYIAVAEKDPLFLLYGTDVGGLYRSIDGGDSWQSANAGFTAHGACSFAIDPHNPDRAIAVGANSNSLYGVHGLYLTTDRARTWTSVLLDDNLGYRDGRNQLAFDPTSFDPIKNRTARVYWSRDGSGSQAAGIYVSTDGGLNWALLPGSGPYAGGGLEVDALSGALFASNASGLYRSTDGGAAFQKVWNQPVTSLDTISSQPGRVWITTPSGVLRSDDGGGAFQLLAPASAFPGPIERLAVSPANPARMVLEVVLYEYVRPHYRSDDGGSTWTEGSVQSQAAFLPFNERPAWFAWHPTDPDRLWSLGGDWITRSVDGGLSLEFANYGNSGFLVGGAFAFNRFNPDLVFFGSQDYGGAFTTDAGASWQYLNLMEAGWGGFVYGGYAISPTRVIGGVAENGWSAPRELHVANKVGSSWVISGTGLFNGGEDFSSGDPKDPSIVFFGNLRSADAGQTWQPMVGCKGVRTASAGPDGRLFGADGSSAVMSIDSGLTWTTIATVVDAWAGEVNDIAFDHVGGLLWFTSWERQLYRHDSLTGITVNFTGNLIPDQLGAAGASSVAVDPVNPEVIYLGCSRDLYASDVSVCRSTDRGATWKVISACPRLGNFEFPTPATEPGYLRVNPKNHALWVASGVYGQWVYDPTKL